MLLNVVVDSTVVEHYPALESNLVLQLAMFHRKFSTSMPSVEQARRMCGMCPEIRALFSEVFDCLEYSLYVQRRRGRALQNEAVYYNVSQQYMTQSRLYAMFAMFTKHCRGR